MLSHRIRLPISTRHAFALAFDLAFRRDVVHSLLVPLSLRLPWILALGVLPVPEESNTPFQVRVLTGAALVGDFLTLVLIGAMLRFRARSVFNTPIEMRPAAASDCYARGFARLPWLVVTEIVRNMAILFAAVFFVLPGVFLGFRLSFATEAVVLHERTIEGAFRRSFRLTEGRFERWFEMIVFSVGLVLGVLFLTVLLTLVFRDMNLNFWVAGGVLATAITPIIQYAWTFFYLRLVETDVPLPVEVGPLYAGTPPAPPEGIPATHGVEATPPNALGVPAEAESPRAPHEPSDDRAPAPDSPLPHVPPPSGSRA